MMGTGIARSCRMMFLRTLLFSTVAALTTSLSCKSETGAAVDWWAAIKAPVGTKYLYGDATNAFAPSAHSMNDTTTGALAQTTRQIWTAPTYVMWNDDPPASTTYNFSYGHTKGFLALDPAAGTGFLVSHSIPNFAAGPALTPRYTALGSNAYTYGQDVFCVSLSAATLNDIAYRLLLTRPQVYDSAVAAGTGGNISALAAGKAPTAATCASSAVATVGGAALTVFGKSAPWGQDLWAGCVAPTMRTGLWVDSWIRGSAEGANCTGAFPVLDVQQIAFASGYSWSETADHSKWAVSSSGDTICFGDINRMTTQFSRGGGAVCMESAALADTFRAATKATNSCGKRLRGP